MINRLSLFFFQFSFIFLICRCLLVERKVGELSYTFPDFGDKKPLYEFEMSGVTYANGVVTVVRVIYVQQYLQDS